MAVQPPSVLLTKRMFSLPVSVGTRLRCATFLVNIVVEMRNDFDYPPAAVVQVLHEVKWLPMKMMTRMMMTFYDCR